MKFTELIGTVCKAQYSVATFVDGKWSAYLRIRDVCIPLSIRKRKITDTHADAFIAVILTKFGLCEIHINYQNMTRIC